MKDSYQPVGSAPRGRLRPSRLFRRRTILGSTGTAVGLSGAAYAAYRSAPGFWKNFYDDLGRAVRPPEAIPDPALWPDEGLHAAWIGHSTVLLKIDGVTVLTDPIFSHHAGVHVGVLSVGVKRVVEAALQPSALPLLDVILLSHAHMDHMDLPSLRTLESAVTTVVAARHTTDLLRIPRYRNVREIGWGEKVRVGPLTIRAVEVRHWGARMRVDTYRGYNGYVLEAGRYSVVIAGDTAYTDAFADLRRTKPHDLIVMPIGAYNPWVSNHCTPEQAWKMSQQAGFDQLMPVHHQTFPLSSEPFLEPIERLVGAAGRHVGAVALRGIGEEVHIL
ncbi:MAG: MBL fold metallo-hydrolase [Bryobacterales bacterium]|nr:MBL fold metallo-hydrolase [Bryobacterales bacterium]